MDKARKQVFTQQATSALLFVAVIVLLGWLSVRFSFEADWTAGNRNTISEASQKQLASMGDPIKVTAFIAPNPEIRRAVEGQISRY